MHWQAGMTRWIARSGTRRAEAPKRWVVAATSSAERRNKWTCRRWIGSSPSRRRRESRRTWGWNGRVSWSKARGSRPRKGKLRRSTQETVRAMSTSQSKSRSRISWRLLPVSRPRRRRWRCWRRISTTRRSGCTRGFTSTASWSAFTVLAVVTSLLVAPIHWRTFRNRRLTSWISKACPWRIERKSESSFISFSNTRKWKIWKIS